MKDNGIGISKADILTKLFQEFRQLDAGLLSQHAGSGLGKRSQLSKSVNANTLSLPRV